MAFVGISVKNEATKYLTDEPKRIKLAVIYALFSTGKQVRLAVKRAPAAGYLGWPKLNPHTGIIASADRGKWISMYRGRGAGRYRYAEKFKTRHGAYTYAPPKLSTLSMPFARAANAIRYNVYATDSMVEIGFLKNIILTGHGTEHISIWEALRKHARGFTRPGMVSGRSSRFFFGIGFPLKKSTKTLRVPARPWLEKVQEREQNNIKQHFISKVNQRLVGLRNES